MLCSAKQTMYEFFGYKRSQRILMHYFSFDLSKAGNYFLILSYLLLLIPAHAQDIASITVSGRVLDRSSSTPVPFATVALVDKDTKKPFAGTTTLEDGTFSIKSDKTNIAVQVDFIGYQSKFIAGLPGSGPIIDMGDIFIVENTRQLDEVLVEAERSNVEFQLDKRVFNVGQDISSTGMGALELLNNVPSVNVDLEGNIRLRGNAGVQVLINGKPSVLSEEGSQALNSITSDMVEKVEVITNPSAKYEAEGTSGIINIVLKKQEKKGLNGSLSVNTGAPANHSVGASLNKRTENFNFFTQFGVGYRSIPTLTENINRNTLANSSVESEGEEFRNEIFSNITLGSDYYINERNTITLSGSFAYEDERQPSETDFEIFENGVLTNRYRRTEETSAGNPKYQYDLQYKRAFKNKEDHELLISTLGRFFGKRLRSEFTNTDLEGNLNIPLQQTKTSFYQSDYTFKADYTNPLSDHITLETGGLYELNDVGNDFEVSNLENGSFLPDSGLTNNFLWYQQVLGIYATLAYEKKSWGVKIGLRNELTDLRTELENTGERNNQNYDNFFPSFHISYKLSELMSLQAGYSRRIFRPRLWDLNPFFNIRNNFNIRMGNPDLQPEFADSYEVTAIFNFEKFSLNTSVYHLYTTEVVERVSVVENNVNITMPMNIGVNNKTGLEINGKYNPARWLTINGDFNYGFFRREGTFEIRNFNFSGDQWSTRINAKFKLPAKFDLEVTANHESSYRTVQGEVSGFTFLNAGLRKKLLDGKLVINAAVQDLFATRIRENDLVQENFELYSFSQRGTFYTLGLSYSFGDGEAMVYSGRRR